MQLYTGCLALTLLVRSLAKEGAAVVSPRHGILLVEVLHNHTGLELVTAGSKLTM